MGSGIDNIVSIIREQGALGNTPELLIGTMTGSNSCTVGDLKLGKEDLFFAEHLLYNVCTEVIVDSKEQTKRTSTETVTIGDEGGSHSHSHSFNSIIKNTDKSKYLKPLKYGDTVLLYPYSETKYIVISKLVQL